jgi:PQQ-like domain/PQQ enzyme repeat
LLACALTARAETDTNSWPMLAHDAGRSGVTPNELQPPFERKWYRLFADEGLMSGLQPIVADGKVFVGTLHGVMHALDAETGKEVWSFSAGGAVLHCAAWSMGKVFFGSANGAVYALNGADGKLAWDVQTGSAVWNAPAVDGGVVYIGSRDQQLYAVEAATGKVLWTAPTEGPLLGSPALDPKLERVYIGSEDMRVYAFDAKKGERVWRSDKLPGVSLRGYHPVIAPDGSVLVTTAPGVSVDTFQALLLEMMKEIFGDFASWRHSTEANATLRDENFALMQKPETYPAQLEFIRKHLAEQPALQTFFVLDPATGRSKFVAPIVYSESMNGPGAPALISPEGQVIVKFQALLRSRYEHYSPFLNVGRLDTATGDITPLMDQSRTYAWYESLLLVHDEQAQLSLGGHILINTHQDNVNGFNLQTQEGFPEPFCRNIHEPKPGEALAIWTRLWRNEPLPNGKEWLARGTAVYGGGSVLDTAVSIAGDSFYYLPTHELNAGAAIIAYRMNPDGSAGKETRVLPEELNADDWKRIQELPWDWDTLEARRLNHVLDALPGKVPGTRQRPLTNEAAQALATLTDADLEPVIWQARKFNGSHKPALYSAGLKADLAQAVRELLSHEWQPLLFPSGKFPEETYRFFSEPTETLYTLALAYPHLDRAIQEQTKEYVRNLCSPEGALAGLVGRRTYVAQAGDVRSAYDPPPERLLKIQDDVLRSDLARLYPLWTWASVAADWSKIQNDWPRLKNLLEQRPNRFEEDCRNGYIAGLIAYCRLAEHMKDTEAVAAGVAVTRSALRDRLKFELAHTRGGLIWQVPRMRSIFARWHFLTPEVGRLLNQQARAIHASLMARYVEYHRPTWWLAWNVETMMRNECPYEFPSMSAEVFAARSLILNETPDKLALFIDRPWCHADLYYIQKLALTLDAATPWQWADVRMPP